MWDKVNYRVKHFSPAWFATLMGVGQTAAALHNFPFGAFWLRVFGIVVWGIAIAMYVVFNLFFITRFIKYPGQFKRMMKHPGQSAFLGCYPMGFATIINMIHFIWGSDAWVACYVLWWIDVVLSLFCTWIVVFVMYVKQTRTIETLNATILLPVVSVIVAGSTGGLLASAQPHTVQPSTLIVSFLLWANGEALAFSCIVIYIYRLYMQSLPPRAMSFSSMLPIGPLGQGSFGILCLAQVMSKILQRQGAAASAEVSLYAGVVVAFFLIGYGTFWVVFCFMVTIIRPPKAFNMSWWGLTFPLGTYVVAWYKLAEQLDMNSLRVIGAFFGVVLMLNVLMCSIGSIYYGVFNDHLFSAVKNETSPDDDQPEQLLDNHASGGSTSTKETVV